MNLSKLVDEDEFLFMSLIEDMFPGIKLTTQTYKELQKAIANATVALGIMNHSEWNLKTIQVFIFNIYTFTYIFIYFIFLHLFHSFCLILENFTSKYLYFLKQNCFV